MDKELRKYLKEGCIRLFYYGCGGGIIAPVLIIIIYNIFLMDLSNHHELILKIFIVDVIIICILACSPLVASRLYEKNKYKVITINWFLYITGILEMAGIGTLIWLTGGARNSLFTFYFFYIPSVIAISFKSKDGIIITCIASLTAIILNVIYVDSDHLYKDIVNTWHYDLQYGLITFFQLLFVCVTEVEEKNLK